MAKKRNTRAGNTSSRGKGARRSAASDKRESGEPGGGQGRRDEIGISGVYPQGADNIPGDAAVRMSGSWGGGDYNESGGSELVYRDGQVLGGLTSGPDGEPTIDIHSNVVRRRLPGRADRNDG